MKENPQLVNLLKHRTLSDYVLIAPIDEVGDDILDIPRQYEDKPKWGVVLSLGDDCEGISKDDFVLFMEYGATTVRSMGVDLLYIKIDDVISKYVEEK